MLGAPTCRPCWCIAPPLGKMRPLPATASHPASAEPAGSDLGSEEPGGEGTLPPAAFCAGDDGLRLPILRERPLGTQNPGWASRGALNPHPTPIFAHCPPISWDCTIPAFLP